MKSGVAALMLMHFPGGASEKELSCQCRRHKRCGFDPWVGMHGNPFQYSCLENPTDRGAWQATVHEVIRVGHDLATKPILLKVFLELGSI